jgi:hypothetical protein
VRAGFFNAAQVACRIFPERNTEREVERLVPVRRIRGR